MTRLDDRLHRAANELQRAARTVPPRRRAPRRTPMAVTARWAAAAAAAVALIALPLWLVGGRDAGPPAGSGSSADELVPYLMGGADVAAFLGSTGADEAVVLLDEIRTWDGVSGAVYVPPGEAVIEFHTMFTAEEHPDYAEVLRAVADDPTLVDGSIRLRLDPDTDRHAIGERLSQLPGVHRVLVGRRADPDWYLAVPANEGVIQTSYTELDPRWAGGVTVVAFLEAIGDTDAAALVAIIEEWPEVVGVHYVSSELVLAEFAELFAHQPTLVRAVTETSFRGELRLALVDDDDAAAVAQRLTTLPGVALVSTWGGDTVHSGRDAAAHRVAAEGETLLTLLGREPVPHRRLLAPLPGLPADHATAMVVASFHDPAFGDLYLVVSEVDPEPDPEIPEGPWFCLTMVHDDGVRARAQGYSCGHTSQFVFPAMHIDVMCTRDGRERRLVSVVDLPTGVEGDVPRTGTLRLSDGTTITVELFGGTALAGWEGLDRRLQSFEIEGAPVTLFGATLTGDGC